MTQNADLCRGIQCPKCGSVDLRVLATRRQENAIMRLRQCDRRHRFETTETVVGFTPDDGRSELLGDLAQARSLAETMDGVLAALIEKMKT